MNMKMKLMATFVLSFIMTAPNMAQEVTLPGFLKFVKVYPGVNIRKSPSTSSPRLMLTGGQTSCDALHLENYGVTQI